MSTAKFSLPLITARRLADDLAGQFRLAGHEVAGSIRRERSLVNDVDLVAPLPPQTGPDDAYNAIAALCDVPGQGLFKPADPLGEAVEGAHPFFRYCSLRIRLKGGELPVQIHRYDPGELGNHGWILLMRTGPKEFGQAFLAHWRRVHALRAQAVASDLGYLRLADGTPVPTPTEERAFERAELEYVPPARRLGAQSIVSRLRVA